jgi:hypothetical protein
MLMSKIGVLLADHHRAIVERVCALLGEDFETVGTMNIGKDAVRAILLIPDLQHPKNPVPALGLNNLPTAVPQAIRPPGRHGLAQMHESSE